MINGHRTNVREREREMNKWRLKESYNQMAEEESESFWGGNRKEKAWANVLR